METEGGKMEPEAQRVAKCSETIAKQIQQVIKCCQGINMEPEDSEMEPEAK